MKKQMLPNSLVKEVVREAYGNMEVGLIDRLQRNFKQDFASERFT